MPLNLKDRAARQVLSIIKSDGLNMDDVDRSLLAAMQRKGSQVTDKIRTIALEATDRVMTNTPLTDEHKAVLETIVIGNGLRPAIDIEHDSFDTLTSVWDDVNVARPILIPFIRSIGRVNVMGHPSVSIAGTAFACGHNLLLTNRHVAEEFLSTASGFGELKFKAGMTAAVDTKQEVGSAETCVLKVTGQGAISENWDVAVLRVDGLPIELKGLPLASAPPAAVANRTAVVIGYPAFDESENLIEQMVIFRSVFNKKRLLPGKFTSTFPVSSYGRTVQALAHDCTTLGGSSGSAVIDIDSQAVFGVHFGGETGIRNYCVPLWALLAEPAFAPFRKDMSFL
jgi:endonuclease G